MQAGQTVLQDVLRNSGELYWTLLSVRLPHANEPDGCGSFSSTSFCQRVLDDTLWRALEGELPTVSLLAYRVRASYFNALKSFQPKESSHAFAATLALPVRIGSQESLEIPVCEPRTIVDYLKAIHGAQTVAFTWLKCMCAMHLDLDGAITSLRLLYRVERVHDGFMQWQKGIRLGKPHVRDAAGDVLSHSR